MQSLSAAAESCLRACEIAEKLHLTQQTAQAWHAGLLTLESENEPELIDEPGRPAQPILVAPGEVPKRRLGTKAGLIALIHAIAHIEFNAINLAWDAVYRYRDLPSQFYSDWIQVAVEEAYHFQLLRERLNELGGDYGDFPAHNGLWDMAMRTSFDPLVRMALVPRVLEARGLDVTPRMIKRLRQAGDDNTTAVLEIILRDEIGHVAIGSHWFKYLCLQRGLDSERTFRELIAQYFTGQITGPFHYEARQKAGFSPAELHALETMNSFQAQPEHFAPDNPEC
ncbi:ferritin-like domain-containing protein [Nitrosomonas sp.]|uniref:ferritin-like domain-containing protein n=1 Tax=Nitrosomonas sp. TaxID=42353 RepID=UPI001DF32F2B|nr:ferritin-like domain-containing protein [Nitrosomonas sp.]MBX3615763.1 ferritin-like domain-containing protein [Nitrosomonas sp.]